MSEEDKPGRITKVLTVDDAGNPVSEWSKQLPEDPFQGQYQYSGLREPPYSLEQLIFLSEQHPTHAACLEQKTADVIGTGWVWNSLSEGSEPTDEDQRKKLDNWFKELAEDAETDDTTHEVLTSAWLDLETTGQGFIELSRDTNGKLRHWFHIPAHTCRFHRDGLRIAQVRGNRRRWFKRWVPKDKRAVNEKTGAVKEAKDVPVNERSNELLVFKRPSRRSSWYGIPTYISSTGWITLSTSARDDNLMFFQNRREPRWAIILENVEDDPEMEESIKRALSSDLEKPHRNLVIPVQGNGKIHFQQLGTNTGDMSFERLQERADRTILTSHRIPGERIGLVHTGALGGSTVEQSIKAYRESFISPSQTTLAAKINKLIVSESGFGKDINWSWFPTELDLASEEDKNRSATQGFTSGVLKLNEARERAGEEPLDDEDERGEKFVFELSPETAAAAATVTTRNNAEQGEDSGHRRAPNQESMASTNKKLADEVQRLVEEPKDSSGGGG